MAKDAMICIKICLFLFNFLVWLGGCCLIGLGVYLEVKYTAYGTIFGNSYLAVSMALIIVGCIVFIVAFLGCCGALQESPCMLFSFAIVIGIIFLTTLVLGIVAYIKMDEVKKYINKSMHQGMKDNYYMKGEMQAWEDLQSGGSCCGTDNYTDWIIAGNLAKNDPIPFRAVYNLASKKEDLPRISLAELKEWFEKGVYNLPISCCANKTKNCTVTKIVFPSFIPSPTTPDDLHKDGCFPTYEQLFNDNMNVIIGIASAVMIMELLDICFAILFGVKINQESHFPVTSFRGSQRTKSIK